MKFPYGFDQLQSDNPYTRFDSSLDVKVLFDGTETNLAGSTLVDVSTQEQPAYDQATQNCALSDTPNMINGDWVLSWIVTPKTADEIKAYTDQIKANNKSNAIKLLSETDWVELPSVTNASNTPHLINADEFILYRNSLRLIAVNPTETPVWPTLPAERWSV